MQDADKIQGQLLQELPALRRRVAELEAAGKRYNDIFEHSGESIFVVDPATLRFLDVNANAARRLGYSRKDLLQLTLGDVEAVDLASQQEAIDWESTVSGTTFYESRHRRRDGSEMPVEVGSRLVQHGQGDVLLLFVRDITVRKQLEAEREELVRELQEALAEVKTLSGLLPMCAYCKSIRDDEGYWHSVEDYMLVHSEARFSHGICPGCMAELYPQIPPMEE